MIIIRQRNSAQTVFLQETALGFAEGAVVYKYGQPIGIASREILPGQHVHVQNLESDRGRGDKKKGDAR